MQRAIAGAVLMGILGGLLGSFATLRQLSFFSHAVGHAALIGVVLGVLLQLNPTWMLLPFSLVFGVLVLYFIDKTDLASDSVLSIVLSGALGIGVILTSFVSGYRGNLMRVLFGDILAIGATDLILTTLLLVISGIFLFSTMQQQILLTLNPDVARVQGVPVQVYRYGFVILLSLAVAVAITSVGVLLVNAFLVIPASTAKLMSHHFSGFLILSIIVGSTTSLTGIIVSGLFNLPSGPSIVLVQFLFFVAVFLVVKLRLKAG
ncbi:metal ABC transporter permease [Chrysosporum ovalisporum Ak1311]|uniref:Metal ABC transporter permease n=3 Tax=Umezakia ovalisporum TaxID=75695 RepID=A0AA43KGV8_9CYAN|nr:metal ABC transporter permease [Umezakia ovalisporum]MBI1240249.1 iron chelate uptake ABC transporter family permease subunit [Nostoc sp. RI_552]MDH6057881.1 metal ABC transporter permease [Umezakia ovalisporum FSS-43]MDH6065562.1 metal ABC transporter permease [Umezakia ovalisporum FSS-62]MDH6068062.1 metal ABC transporter permease [Umezakia ovalisporum APH033B]MDH6071905.1 metal ABC transporter permease [Umezakia ovalisporum CobakiLakeA]